jgi:hypothetical protein
MRKPKDRALIADPSSTKNQSHELGLESRICLGDGNSAGTTCYRELANPDIAKRRLSALRAQGHSRTAEIMTSSDVQGRNHALPKLMPQICFRFTAVAEAFRLRMFQVNQSLFSMTSIRTVEAYSPKHVSIRRLIELHRKRNVRFH